MEDCYIRMVLEAPSGLFSNNELIFVYGIGAESLIANLSMNIWLLSQATFRIITPLVLIEFLSSYTKELGLGILWQH